MTSPKSRVYPRPTTNSYVTVSDDDLPLITYDQLGSKSTQELLYEAASESDQNKAKNKWQEFTKKVNVHYLTHKEIHKVVHHLDEQKQWSALHYAVANNNYFVAKILIGRTYLYNDYPYKCDINILGGNGENVLHVAAQSNKLWQKNNNYQRQELNGSRSTLGNIVVNYESPLSEDDIPLIVKMLIERNWYETNIQMDHEDEEGRTPLHLAVMANRHSFVSYLLDNGAHLEAITKMNANVFHFIFVPSYPLQTGDALQKMFEFLYDKAENNQKLDLLQSRTLDNRSPLVLAVCHPKCTESIIEKLIEVPDVNQFLFAFDLAAKRHIVNFELLRPLLNYLDSDKNNQRNKLIQIACRHDHVRMLEWLVKQKNFHENLHTKSYAGHTPLLTAVFYEAKECVKYLLKTPNINWKEQNDDGETILHILAERNDDSDLFKIIWNEITKQNEMENVMMIKDDAGNTPLHCAARSNQLEICKQFLSITDNKTVRSTSLLVINMINEKNSLGQTPVLVACEMGYKEIVAYFWDAIKENRKAEIFKRDDDRRSCLHLAAAKGYLEVVKYLMETVHMDVDIIADRRITPLHLACQYGHSDVVTYLLEHNASPTLRDARLYNCLEIAIMDYRYELVQNVLFEHPLWRDMMRNAQPIQGTNAYDTPMRKLIRYMPEVTIHIIDKKLTRIVGGPGQKVFKRIYDYEFFQDELTVEGWYTQGTVLDSSPKSLYDRYKNLSWTETIRCAFCCFCCSNPNIKNRNDSTPYTDNSYILVRNHPLFIASQQSSCPELVQHPFNICLRKKKFNMFGIYLLILSCLLYSTYLSIFTALVLQNKDPQYYYSLINVNYTEDLTTCEYVSNTLVNENKTEAFKSNSYKILRWFAFGFLILFIIKNILLIISLFPKLLRMGVLYLEISVLVLSFVYILDWYNWLNPVLLRCPVQYQIGSFAILLAWINFLTYVRYVPIANIGVYVVMLQVILKRFLQFLPVLIIIICGFGFAYWMLLQNQSVYATPIEALIRTGLMMFDLGYEDRLYKSDEGGIGYYKILYVMFILTAIVFCIFLINLMISLAVGELPSLKDQSITWRHQMMYDLLSDYEILRIQLRPIMDCFTCGYLNKTQRRGPSIFKFLQRRQDVTIQQDENHVFWLLRFGRYTQKHFFEERIQDDVALPVKKKKKEEEE